MMPWLQDSTLLTLLISNVVQAIVWLFAFRKRKVENDSSEAAALNSIRELNNSIAADLKERYDEQAARIKELEDRERTALSAYGELQGQVSMLSQQHAGDKILIQKLNEQIAGYKAEVAGWKAKFENLQKQFMQLKNRQDEK